MQRHVTHSLLLGTLLCLSATAQAAFITDKIVVNLYAQSSADQNQVLKKLPSGTSVDVISIDGQYTHVRTTDGTTGWVSSQFITNERPTQLEYLELLAKNKTLEASLKTAQDKLAAAPATTTTSSLSPEELADLQQRAKDAAWMRVELKKARDKADELESQMNARTKSTTTSQQELDKLRAANKALEERLAATLLVNAQQQPEPVTTPPEDETATPITMEPAPPVINNADDHWRVKIEWFLGSILVALIAGAITGMTWLDNRIRRRHGGFRIY